MAELKTRETGADVAAFLDAVPDAGRRADAHAVATMLERLTGDGPAMWGPSIVGFGSYHYRYESGHEGDACRVGFSPRKTELVLYILDGNADQSAALARLGKHRAGKGCLYIKRLADVDQRVLEDLVRDKIGRMNAQYPR